MSRFALQKYKLFLKIDTIFGFFSYLCSQNRQPNIIDQRYEANYPMHDHPD